jgi:hypothetical protein
MSNFKIEITGRCLFDLRDKYAPRVLLVNARTLRPASNFPHHEVAADSPRIEFYQPHDVQHKMGQTPMKGRTDNGKQYLSVVLSEPMEVAHEASSIDLYNFGSPTANDIGVVSLQKAAASQGLTLNEGATAAILNIRGGSLTAGTTDGNPVYFRHYSAVGQEEKNRDLNGVRAAEYVIWEFQASGPTFTVTFGGWTLTFNKGSEVRICNLPPSAYQFPGHPLSFRDDPFDHLYDLAMGGMPTPKPFIPTKDPGTNYSTHCIPVRFP